MENEDMYQLLIKMKEGDQQAFHTCMMPLSGRLPDSLLSGGSSAGSGRCHE
ncbi:hypothetical protein P615_18040 [Brevibacillus laterosporus PE36]|nr:hypothetical protein [Brevibacillus laterosporus]ERM18248.1 hypothetical protein P615_18040 [Brevibacillus laterosporus PE36]